MNIDTDAFSTGQILSKLWLAENLERVIDYQDILESLNILVIGGWYGMLNFILRSRNNLRINSVRNIDIDQSACDIADIINKSWVWKDWQFKSLCQDANTFQYTKENFNLIINTSVEHFQERNWFNNIPKGTLTVLQSNNMTHDTHCNNHDSLESFMNDFQLSDVYYSGEKLFEYPDWKFTRYMIIGIK